MVDELQASWFDYWLKGEGDVTEWPAVRLFVMGENRWRNYDAWPPPGTRIERWFLHSGGRSTSFSGDGALSQEAPAEEPPDVYVYNPFMPVPSAGGRSCCVSEIAPIGPFEQSYVETRNDVSSTRRSPSPGHRGDRTVELVLYAATDAVDTDWTAKLVDVIRKGTRSTSVTASSGHVSGSTLERRTPIEPERVYEYRIRIGSTANLFKKGHRIRLEVSSSNFPMFDINPNNGQRVGEATQLQGRVATQAVFHDANRASHLLVPVVGR